MMRALSLFLVPGGVALFVALIGIVSIIRERRRAQMRNKARPQTAG